MSGGKGGSQTTSTEIPAWAQEYAQRELLNRAAQAAAVGFMPYYGPDVAAMTPAQEAAMASNIGAAEAYGLIEPGSLSPTSGMPAAQTFAGGVRGYSSGGLCDQARAMLAARQPGQMAAYNAMFVDPMTGLLPQMSSYMENGQPSADYIEFLRSQGIEGLPTEEEIMRRRRQETERPRDYTLGGRIS